MTIYIALGLIVVVGVVAGALLFRRTKRSPDPEKALRAKMGLTSVTVGALPEEELTDSILVNGVELYFSFGGNQRRLKFSLPISFVRRNGRYGLDQDSDQFVSVTLSGAGYTRNNVLLEVSRAIEAALEDRIKNTASG